MPQALSSLKKHIHDYKDLYLMAGVFLVIRMSNKQPKFQQFIILSDIPKDDKI